MEADSTASTAAAVFGGLPIFACAAIVLGAAAGVAVWRGLDVRVNVLLLAMVMLAVAAMAFEFALAVDADGDAARAEFAAALQADTTTAAQRVEALAELLAADRAYTRDLLSVAQVGVGVITALSLAMGALLQKGNDLADPMRQALDKIGVTDAEFSAAMDGIEGALAQLRDIVAGARATRNNNRSTR